MRIIKYISNIVYTKNTDDIPDIIIIIYVLLVGSRYVMLRWKNCNNICADISDGKNLSRY